LPALIASVTIFAPFIAGMPNGPAAPPVKKLGTAIVIASFASAVLAPNVIAEMAANPAARAKILCFIFVSHLGLGWTASAPFIFQLVFI
jgi:hypothetical protein